MIHAVIPGLAISDNETQLIGETYFFVNDVLVAGLMSLLTISSFCASTPSSMTVSQSSRER
jgi:hypothetical protein